ncbi:MAG: phosphotransferase family protein [Caulobacteraceae bacterium]|nr:phosphotransferase family protein [Caulobacteraceae bacterium]
MQDLRDALPDGLASRLEAETGARIAAVRMRAGGGASRDGAELDLESQGILRAYLSFDTRRGGDPQRLVNFRREVAILRALSGPLADAGVAVPRVLAADPACLALLTGYVPGEANFNRLHDQAERRATALDFMRQLAALHALDVGAFELDGYGDPARAWTDSLQRIRALKAAVAERQGDPQILFALDWLERHAPPPPERIVVLHGDCGPGNFLYQGGRVTAHLDWELTRYGDPMEDLAMLCIRNLLQSFIPLPEAFAAYEAAGGAPADLARIRHHRLSNQLGFVASAQAAGSPEPPVLGMSLVYHAMHMRIMVESLAELAGVALAATPLPELPPGPNAASFEIALKDLRDVIVPGARDQQASEKAKGLARLVKFWRERERFGAAFDALETDEIGRMLGRRFADLADARAGLRRAVLDRSVDDEAMIHLCHRRAARETALMADAMGALSRTHFAPLAP